MDKATEKEKVMSNDARSPKVCLELDISLYVDLAS